MVVRLQILSALVVALAVAVPIEGTAVQDRPAHDHIGHVLHEFGGTPDGEGLFPTALAEARTAIQHAELAAGDLGNLDGIKMHTEHVLHAVDPEQVDGGPGAGFGVKAAAEGIAEHIRLAAGSDGASHNLVLNAEHVATAARAVAERAEGIVELAQQILAADSAEAAAPLVEELVRQTENLLVGDHVGVVEHRPAGYVGTMAVYGGGLETVEQHMRYIAAAEGIRWHDDA